ncbi:MAG: trimethylamine methyltransferase family protein, partial [Methylocella sp.]
MAEQEAGLAGLQRRSRRRAGHTAGAGKGRTPNYRGLVNPFEPLRVFSDDQVEAIHQNALRLLEEIGMRVLLPAAREKFKAAGAAVNDDTMMAHIDRGLVA